MIPNDLCVIHAINGVPIDVSALVVSASISGRLGTPSRSLQVEFLDVDGSKAAQSVDINPMRGDQVTFSYKGAELFRGMWMAVERSDSRILSATAYDLGIYLSNNSDTFCYEDPMSAADVFRDVCARFGIPMGDVADTSYTIDELVESKTTGWDVISAALERTYDATGERYCVYASEGKLNLVRREDNIRQWVIENGVNLQAYSKTLSTENIRTRIKLYSQDDQVVAEAVNSDLESALGRMQEIQSASDDELEQGKAEEIVKTAIKTCGTPDESMDVTATGIPDVITGTGIYVRIRDLGQFEKVCYVQEDTHTWDRRSYTMDLRIAPAQSGSSSADAGWNTTLNEWSGPSDGKGGPSGNLEDFIPHASAKGPSNVTVSETLEGLETPPGMVSPVGGGEVGTLVTFAGGPHYTSNSATEPTGGMRTAGAAKITQVAKGTPHPYHLVGEMGGSNVWGWVDEGSFR